MRLGNDQLPLVHFSILLVIIFASAMATNLIGIFAIFGPFVLGACLWDQHAFREAVTSRLRDFVNAFFLPIFFTYTGLHTDVGLLNTGSLWLLAALVCAVAIVGKMGACGLAARFVGLSWRHSSLVAVMMNTRALMGLIAITVGREMGVIPDSVFSMLVIMAVLTTFMTVPIMRRLLRPEDHPAIGIG
jgi:Kef-type K+ transport system membrane component KefB